MKVGLSVVVDDGLVTAPVLLKVVMKVGLSVSSPDVGGRDTVPVVVYVVMNVGWDEGVVVFSQFSLRSSTHGTSTM